MFLGGHAPLYRPLSVNLLMGLSFPELSGIFVILLVLFINYVILSPPPHEHTHWACNGVYQTLMPDYAHTYPDNSTNRFLTKF